MPITTPTDHSSFSPGCDGASNVGPGPSNVYPVWYWDIQHVSYIHEGGCGYMVGVVSCY